MVRVLTQSIHSRVDGRPPRRTVEDTENSSGRQPVHGLAVQVFAQRLPDGTAPARAGIPLQSIPLGPDDAALAGGRTDDTGAALVAVPRKALLFNGNGLPLVCARIVEPGYQQWVGRGKSAKDEGADCEVTLFVRRGATARGRLVDAEGLPVEAYLRAMRWIATPEGKRLRPVSLARLLARGAFELDFAENVGEVVLLADGGERGTGGLGGVRLSLESPPNDLCVVVSGPGRLRGRVLGGGGEPAAGLELLVLLAALDDGRGTLDRPEPETSLRLIEGGGLLWSELETDDSGAFDARGLRADTYLVRARTGQERHVFPALLTPAPVTAKGAELVLCVARPHIVVRLLDAGGRPLSVQVPRYVDLSRNVLDWPSEPWVMVLAVQPDGVGGSVAADALGGKRLDGGEMFYEVEAGARYLVQGRGAGFDGIPREVDMPMDQDRVVVELRAREPVELGAVAVRGMTGKRESDFSLGFDVRLESRDGAVPFLKASGYGNDEPVVLRAPPGLYRVVAEGTAETNFQHGYVEDSRALGRAESEVELRAGVTQEIVLELDAGANLEVAVAGTASDTDREPAHVPRLWSPKELQRLASLPYAKLFLLHAGRLPEPVLFEELGFLGTTAGGKHLFDDWPLGEAHVSARLPTGRFTLLARSPDGRETRTEVELRPGQTTRVELEF